jgi:hypothetical protein
MAEKQAVFKIVMNKGTPEEKEVLKRVVTKPVKIEKKGG